MEQRVDTPTLLLFKAQLYYYSGSAKQNLPESKIYRTCLQNTGHQGIWKRTMRRKGFPGGSVVKNLPANAGDAGDVGSVPGLGRSLGERNGNPLQYTCLEKSHGQRSLMGYSPQGRKELDMTEHPRMQTGCASACGMAQSLGYPFSL